MYIKFGVGLQSFYCLIRRLISTYLVLALIASVQMTILYCYNSNNKNQDWFGKMTLGGFPFSRPICKIIPAKVGVANFECEGDDTIITVLDFGFLPDAEKISHDKECTADSCCSEVCYEPKFRKSYYNWLYDDKFACDRELQRHLKDTKYFKNNWYGKSSVSANLIELLPDDSQCKSNQHLWENGMIFVQAACGST